MAASPALTIEVKLDYGPLLDQLGLPEIVAEMRHAEYFRGLSDCGRLGTPLPWDDEPNKAAWTATAREKLVEALNGRI